jgi:hypothetical protein
MVVISVFCSRCRKVIVEGRSNLTPTCGPAVQARESLDLCPECWDRFSGWLAAGPNGPALDALPSFALGEAGRC